MELISKSSKGINLLQTYNVSFKTNLMSITKDVINKEVTFEFLRPSRIYVILNFYEAWNT